MTITATPRTTCVDTATTSASGAQRLLNVIGQETLVPLVDGSTLAYANLDTAASAQALEAVAERVSQVLPYYASVHRGAGYLSQVSTALYEAARQAIGEFVAAREDDATIITRNTTDSINLLAGCIPAHADGRPGTVVVIDLEHHANLLPWREAGLDARVLPVAPTITETLAELSIVLSDAEVTLVTVSGASNVTGESLPLGDVIELAHRHGARILIDGAQLVPHRGFSLAASDADYVAFSGHKTYAPYGAGALVGRRDWLDTGKPYLAGGGAVRSVSTTEVEWQVAPARHEAGSPNVIGAVALAAACEALGALGVDELVEHEHALRDRLASGLAAIDGVQLARIWPDSVDPVGVVTFSVTGHDPGLVAAYLAAEHGIGVRDGKFCAHPLLKSLGLSDGALRASVGVSTTTSDVDRLIAGVRAYLSQGPTVTYVVDNGCWVVADDPRPLPNVAGLSQLAGTAAAGLLANAFVCSPE